MFLDISTENITELLGYVKGLLGDLSPLLLLVVAIGLGIFFFWGIISAIK